MNEVGMSQSLVQQSVLANASSAGAENAQKTQQVENGKLLPKVEEVKESAAAAEESKEQEQPQEKLGDMVETVNQHVQSIQRDLEFSVDNELEKTVVKVVDSDSGKLIRQIPEDIFLDLARNLMQSGELKLVDAQG